MGIFTNTLKNRRQTTVAERSRSRNRRRRLFLEHLEDRKLLATFSVLNTGDTGSGSLRNAIELANSTPNVGGPDMIEFKIPGTGVHTISPLSNLPTVTDPVIIDGYSQFTDLNANLVRDPGEPGAIANTLGIGPGSLGHDLGDGDNAVILIELDGSQAGGINTDGNVLNFIRGLRIDAGDSTIRGLAINRFSGFGIFLTTHANNTISGNFIGTDPTGLIAKPNVDSGVLVSVGQYGSQPNFNGIGNTIGGLTPDARNVISGNGGTNGGTNLHVEPSDNNLVVGNFIGTDATGSASPIGASSLRAGLFISGYYNTIGGATANARNVISGNQGTGSFGNGIEVGSDRTVAHNRIIGNFIGTDVTGKFALGNRNGISDNASGSDIGGNALLGEGNLISGNTANGVAAAYGSIKGNLIGTDVTGKSSVGNGNGIFAAAETIGGTTQADRNVISGNGQGIFLIGGGNVVQGNYVGTDITGMVAMGNASQGIFIHNGNGDLIGGNVIAASEGYDIRIQSSTNVSIQGNFIGVDKTGNNILSYYPFLYGAGILVDAQVTNLHIGGAVAEARNVIGGHQVGIGVDGAMRFLYAVTTSGVVVEGN